MRLMLGYANGLTDEQVEYLAARLEQRPFERNFDELPSFKEMQSMWNSMIPQTRILCLAEEFDNPVMWSTYSEGYTWVVIELEALDVYDSFLLIAEPVIYSDELPTLGTLDVWARMTTGQIPFDYDATFRKLELTKARKWSYEKEWRVLSFDKGSTALYSDYKTHSQTFNRVFFGNKISAIDRGDLLHLMSQELSHLKGLDMRVDHSTQRLLFDVTEST
jgi:hypothetical protein